MSYDNVSFLNSDNLQIYNSIIKIYDNLSFEDFNNCQETKMAENISQIFKRCLYYRQLKNINASESLAQVLACMLEEEQLNQGLTIYLGDLTAENQVMLDTFNNRLYSALIS